MLNVAIGFVLGVVFSPIIKTLLKRLRKSADK